MEQKSFKFKHIENNLVKLLSLLLSSQNIARYIIYLNDDPLNLLLPDVTVDLMENGNISLTLFDEKVLTDNKVKIFLNPYNGSLKTMPLSDIVFVMDIIMQNTYWVLSGMGQLRPYRISDEFAQLVDGQKVAGIGEVNITNFKAYKVNDTYSGLSLFIEINSSTLKGLR